MIQPTQNSHAMLNPGSGWPKRHPGENIAISRLPDEKTVASSQALFCSRKRNSGG